MISRFFFDAIVAVSLVGGFACAQAGRARAVADRPPTAMTVSCPSAQAHIESLYRSEASVASGAQPEMVADNVAMVMAECARRGSVASCSMRVSSARQLERECLVALDDDGSEGDAIARSGWLY